MGAGGLLRASSISLSDAPYGAANAGTTAEIAIRIVKLTMVDCLDLKVLRIVGVDTSRATQEFTSEIGIETS